MPIKERPILFNTFSIDAYLSRRKWQTRRVIKPQPVLGKPWGKSGWTIDPEQMDLPATFCPYGTPGDSLWVRETWGYVDGQPELYYRADPIEKTWRVDKWHPSIFMPRWASRIQFPVLSIRAEQVQSISEDDAFAEGIHINATEYERGDAVAMYRIVWDTINAGRGFGWDTNPWVWVVEFPRHDN